MDLFTHAHEQRLHTEAPGSGKTTLTMVIANLTKSHFDTLSAVLAGKAELRDVLEAATERRKLYQKKTILFVDELHVEKAQQDALSARRKWRRHPHRRDHRKSILRGDRPPDSCSRGFP